MMTAIRNALKNVPLARYAYAKLRGWHDRHEGGKVFMNPELYVRALYRKGNGTAVLRTHDGLSITVRQNLWDARIVREMFFDKPYIRRITLRPQPIVVDIGGYIGDFSIYAVRYLGAARVIVYEPTAENFELLKRNVQINGYADRIVAVNRAVSSSDQVTLNVRLDENDEVHVSAYFYQGAQQRKLPSVTLEKLFETHRLDSIDLLKIDCEGGEYDIFPAIPDHLFNRIENIVFEYHRIDGFETKLDKILGRLRSAGYALYKDGGIVSACRH